MISAHAPEAFGEEYLDWKDWDPERFGRYSVLDARYFEAEFGLDVPTESRVLEIGFGNGATLGWLVAAGADVFGTEANAVLVERAARVLGPGRTFPQLCDEELSRLAGTFTHVLAIDVIEHVPLEQIAPMLRRIHELLAPGGRCVLRFPNGDSPFGRVYQHGDPTHITTLGSARIMYLARQGQLEVETIRAPALPVRNVGLMRGLKRRCVIAARRMVEGVVGILYFGGRRIPLDANYTVVLRRPLIRK